MATLQEQMQRVLSNTPTSALDMDFLDKPSSPSSTAASGSGSGSGSKSGGQNNSSNHGHGQGKRKSEDAPPSKLPIYILGVVALILITMVVTKMGGKKSKGGSGAAPPTSAQKQVFDPFAAVVNGGGGMPAALEQGQGQGQGQGQSQGQEAGGYDDGNFDGGEDGLPTPAFAREAARVADMPEPQYTRPAPAHSTLPAGPPQQQAQRQRPQNQQQQTSDRPAHPSRAASRPVATTAPTHATKTRPTRNSARGFTVLPV